VGRDARAAQEQGFDQGAAVGGAAAGEAGEGVRLGVVEGRVGLAGEDAGVGVKIGGG
jgi:hypothetical protein